MWTSKLFWKLFFIYTGLSLGLAVVFLWTVAGLFDRFAAEYVTDDLEQTGTTLLSTIPGNASDPVPVLMQRVKQHLWQREHQAFVLDPQGNPLHGELLSGPAGLSAADRQALQRGETLRWRGRTRKGEAALFVALPLRASEQLEAILLLAVPTPKLDPRLATVRQTLWPLVFLLTLASVVVLFWVLTRTSRRLTQLTLGAQAIADTDDPQLIPLESLDELGLLGAALNKMQQKLARRMHELRENSERLETMLGSMVEGVLAVSPELDVLLANNASCKLLGITIDQPLGRPLLDVTRSLPLHAAVVEAIQSNLPVTREFESNSFPRKTLTVRAMNMPGTPSPGVMVVLHDMTELRRLENLRREFVANVSHELKTPLSVIKAYAETLKMGAINDPEHSLDFVNRIEEQAERLYELILDLLQLARIESGQEVFDIVDVDLSEAVLDCVEQYADLATSKRIRLVPEGPEDPVVVRGDEEGVRTILSNLINNAVKYTPEGGSVTVRWRHEEGLGVLEVEDTGIGIAPRDQARIFERFYRVDRARSRELGGTGLGLSIVKQLTQAFGGTAGVESKPQKGSLFWVRLPCEKSQTSSLQAVVSS